MYINEMKLKDHGRKTFEDDIKKSNMRNEKTEEVGVESWAELQASASQWQTQAETYESWCWTVYIRGGRTQEFESHSL